jgi:hypothetical protein
MTDCTTIPVPIYGYRMYLYGIKSLVLLVTVYLSLRILSLCIYKRKFRYPMTLPLIYRYGQFCGSSSFSKRIRIHLFTSIRFMMDRKHRYRYYVRKPFLKAGNHIFVVNFGQFPCSWIRIRIHNTDPGKSNQCGSRSEHWVRYLVSYGVLLLLVAGCHSLYIL